jgi:hypothetical protein
VIDEEAHTAMATQPIGHDPSNTTDATHVPGGFDAVFAGSDIRIIRTRPSAPQANDRRIGTRWCH